MKFKYSEGDVVGNLEIKGLGGTSKSGTRLYRVLCLLCGSVTDKRLQTIERAQSCGCMQSKRSMRVVGSGRRSAEGTRVEINTLISIYKSNARKRGVPFDLTYTQFETLVDSECYFCGDIEITHQYHDTLNELLWKQVDDTYELHSDVKKALRENADAFFEFLDVPKAKIVDVVLTGSAANFN